MSVKLQGLATNQKGCFIFEGLLMRLTRAWSPKNPQNSVFCGCKKVVVGGLGRTPYFEKAVLDLRVFRGKQKVGVSSSLGNIFI